MEFGRKIAGTYGTCNFEQNVINGDDVSRETESEEANSIPLPRFA